MSFNNFLINFVGFPIHLQQEVKPQYERNLRSIPKAQPIGRPSALLTGRAALVAGTFCKLPVGKAIRFVKLMI